MHFTLNWISSASLPSLASPFSLFSLACHSLSAELDFTLINPNRSLFYVQRSQLTDYVPRNKQLSLNCSQSWKIYGQMIRVDKENNGNVFAKKQPQSLKTNWCFNYHLGVACPLHSNDFSSLEADLSFSFQFFLQSFFRAFLKLRWKLIFGVFWRKSTILCFFAFLPRFFFLPKHTIFTNFPRKSNTFD